MVPIFHLILRVHGYMDNHIKIKNVILRDVNLGPLPAGYEGLEFLQRRQENGENYMSLMGTKAQINSYLQDKPIISDRLRTLKNVPHARIINTKLVEIY